MNPRLFTQSPSKRISAGSVAALAKARPTQARMNGSTPTIANTMIGVMIALSAREDSSARARASAPPRREKRGNTALARAIGKIHNLVARLNGTV